MPRLTPSEQRVLDLVSEGKGNGLIAEELVIQKKSVENAIRHIYSKLGLTTREGYDPRVSAVLWNLLKLGPGEHLTFQNLILKL